MYHIWTCNECKHGFQQPGLFGQEPPERVCPNCFGVDIQKVETEIDPDVLFRGEK